MKLEEYIETLSEEEKERHKDLIDECRSRMDYTRKCINSIIWQDQANLSTVRNTEITN